MRSDPIIAQVRKVRDAYAKRFGYDLKRIFADLRMSERKRAADARPSAAPGAPAKPKATKAAKRRRRAA